MKNICLTFDDGLKSNFEFVRPLLKSNGIKGTFFICIVNPWEGHPLREELLTVEQLKKMESEGFELGNHTKSHLNLKEVILRGDDKVEKEIVAVNDFFKKHNLKMPVSFCYPGYHACEKISNVLKKLNFSHARSGYIYDDHQSQHSKEVERPQVSYYSKKCKSSLLIKSTGIVNDIYGFDDFITDIEKSPKDTYCVFTFHGFLKDARKKEFLKIIKYIKENNFSTFTLSELPVNI